jgi:hypothetical protein
VGIAAALAISATSLIPLTPSLFVDKKISENPAFLTRLLRKKESA